MIHLLKDSQINLFFAVNSLIPHYLYSAFRLLQTNADSLRILLAQGLLWNQTCVSLNI
jgi:hypothetical protein